MAGSSTGGGLECQLLDQFMCALCKGQLKQPRALPCLHSFCEECLRNQAGDELFVHHLTCKTCQQEVTVPGGNISNFPVDFLANRFLSLVMEMCPEATPTGGGGQSAGRVSEKDRQFEMCYGHDKIKDMYCHACKQVYCTECSGDHVDHPIGTVKDAAMAAVQSMTSLASAARERLPDLQVQIEEIRQSVEEIEEEHREATDSLNHGFEEVLRVLKERRKELLRELGDLRYDRVSVLKMKNSELRATIKRILELSQSVTECLEGDTDTNVLYKEDELSEALYVTCNKSFVAKDDVVHMEYAYRPKYQDQAMEVISALGEIEFLIEEDESEDESTEDEEERARREIEGEEEKEVIDEREAEKIEEEAIVGGMTADEPTKEDVLSSRKNMTASRNDLTEEPISEKDSGITTNEGEPSNHDTTATEANASLTSSTETTKLRAEEKEITREYSKSGSIRQSTRSTRRAHSTTRDNNPCYEVSFSAPEKATLSRYREISCTPIIQLGEKGNHEDDSLYYPYGLTITREDQLLVSDQGNSRVQLFDMATQRSIIRFGGEGSNPGQFSSPSGIASHEGMCYVSDTGNDRVQIFDTSGVFVTCLGQGELHAPRGVTVAGNTVYVANSGNGNISVFDVRTGALTEKLRNMTPHSCDLHLPTGVTTDLFHNLYYSDANNFFCNHFIQVLSQDHQYSHSIGVVGNKPGEFLGPSDLAIDDMGNVIVADTRNHRIQIIDKKNNLVACFGGFGRKMGLLHFPYGVCEKDGALFVSDTNNHRIQVFNKHI